MDDLITQIWMFKKYWCDMSFSEIFSIIFFLSQNFTSMSSYMENVSAKCFYI